MHGMHGVHGMAWLVGQENGQYPHAMAVEGKSYKTR
jgi:hypothetical protein